MDAQNDLQLEFLKSEAEYLREFYDSSINQTRNIEKYVITVMGIVWSWCIVNPDKQGVNYLVWLPFFVVFLFGLRALSIYHLACAARNYLLNIETTIYESSNFGWTKEREKAKYSTQFMTAWFFWICITIAALLFPLFVKFQ